jgi:predicted metal-dependent peptidase
MEKLLKEQNIKPDCIIMFTDGYVPNWGTDWNGAPILWVITGGGRMTATTGKTIYID